MMKKNNVLLYGPFADWQKPSDYPVPGETLPRQWAWEFLRRNPKYQKQCKNFEGKTILLKDRFGGIRRKFGVREIYYPMGEKPPYRFFIKNNDPVVGGVCEEFWQESIYFNMRLPLKPQIEYAEEALNRIQKSDNRLIHNRRVPWNKFPEYLRLLDAQAIGISKKEMSPIFSHLECTPQAVNHGLKEAIKWRDGDYALLPLLGHTPF